MPQEQNIGVRVLVLGLATASRQLGTFRSDLQRVSNEVNRSKTSIADFSKELNKAGAAMSSFGRTLTLSLTAPITALTGSLLKAGSDFETAFAGVARTAEGVARGFDSVAEEMFGTSKGLTQLQKDAVFANDAIADLTEEGKKLRKEFIDMSLEIPISATELAGVGVAAGQLGITGTENIARFTETITKFGVATNITADSAAESIARIGNIMGVTSDEMADFAQQAGDAIVHLGNTAASTETEIINLSYRIAGAGRAVGLTTPEILGLSSALASAGIRAEMGGSAISRILTTMSFALNGFNSASSASTEQIADLDRHLGGLEERLTGIQMKGAADLVDVREIAGLGFGSLQSDIDQIIAGTKSVADVINELRTEEVSKIEGDIVEAAGEFKYFAKVAGLSLEQFQNMVRNDPVRALQALLTGLTRLQEEGKLTSDVLDSLELNTIRLKDVILRLGPNQQLITDNINNANEAWSEGIALEEEFAKQSKTINNQLKLLKNSFNALGIALFDVVHEDLANLIKGFRSVIDQIRNLDPAMLKLALKIGLIAAALGPGLIVFGTFLQLLSVGIGSFSTFGNILKSFLLLPISPFGVIGKFLFGTKGEAGARTGGLLKSLSGTKLFGKIGDLAKGILNIPTKLIGGLTGALSTALRKLLTGVFGGIGKTVSFGGSLITTIARGLLSIFTGAFGALASLIIGPTGSFLGAVFKTVLSSPLNIIKILTSGLGGIIGALGGPIFKVLISPFKLFGGILGKIISLLPAFGSGIVKFVLGTLGKLPLIIAGIAGALTLIFAPKVITQLVKNWDSVLQQLKLGTSNFVKDFKENGLEKAILLFTSGGSTGSGRLGGIFGISLALGASVENAQRFSYALGTASYWVIQIVKGFLNAITTLKNLVTGSKNIEKATGGTAERLISFAEFLAKLFEGMNKGLRNTFDLFVGGIDNLLTGVGAAIKGLSKLFDALFGNAEKGISDTFNTLAVGEQNPALTLGERIGEIVNTIIYLVTSGIGAIGQVVGAVAGFFGDIISAYNDNGVKGVLTEIGTSAASLWNGLVSALDTIWDFVKPKLQTFLTSLTDWLINTGIPGVVDVASWLGQSFANAISDAITGRDLLGFNAIENSPAANSLNTFVPFKGPIPQDVADSITARGEQNFTFEPVYSMSILDQVKKLINDIYAVFTSENTKTKFTNGIQYGWLQLTGWLATNAWPTVEPIIDDFISSIESKFNEKKPELEQTGRDIGDWILNGLADKLTPDFIGKLFSGDYEGALREFSNQLSSRVGPGNFIADKEQELHDKTYDLLAKGIDPLTDAEWRTIAENFYGDFPDEGNIIVRAFIRGVQKELDSQESKDAVEGRLTTMFKSAVDKLKSDLGIRSPSTVFEAIGRDVIQGFVNGIYNNASNMTNALNAVTNAVSTMRSGLGNILNATVQDFNLFSLQMTNSLNILVNNLQMSLQGLSSGLQNSIKSVTSNGAYTGSLNLGVTNYTIPNVVSGGNMTTVTNNNVYSPNFSGSVNRTTLNTNKTVYQQYVYAPKAVG